MKGFVNSWAIAFLAFSLIVVLYAFSTVPRVSSIDAGYFVEIARWAGDFSNISCVTGAPEGINVDSNKLGYTREGSTSHVTYASDLIDLEVNFTKNYRPYASFNQPQNGSEIDCTSYSGYYFSWYSCDPDNDELTFTLKEVNNTGQHIIYTGNSNYVLINCSNLTAGVNDYELTVTDGRLSYTDVVTNVTVLK